MFDGYQTNSTISFFIITFLIIFTTISCGRKKARKGGAAMSIGGKKAGVNSDATDVSNDEATDQTFVEIVEDYLSNVNLLTPALPGGCDDDNAAREAKLRHDTNQYYPKLEVQKKRIVNGTTQKEIKKMLDELPPHPPQQFRTKLGTSEEQTKDRNKKWENVHVNWHPVGLVFLVRSLDVSRSKDDGVQDTADTTSGKEIEALLDQNMTEQINSEMPMSDTNKMAPTPNPKEKTATVEKTAEGSKEKSEKKTKEKSEKKPKDRSKKEKTREQQQHTKAGKTREDRTKTREDRTVEDKKTTLELTQQDATVEATTPKPNNPKQHFPET